MDDIAGELTLVGVIGLGFFVATKMGVLGQPKIDNNTPIIGALVPGRPANPDVQGDIGTPPGMLQTTPGDTVKGALCAAQGGVYDALTGTCFGNDNGQVGSATGGNW